MNEHSTMGESGDAWQMETDRIKDYSKQMVVWSKDARQYGLDTAFNTLFKNTIGEARDKEIHKYGNPAEVEAEVRSLPPAQQEKARDTFKHRDHINCVEYEKLFAAFKDQFEPQLLKRIEAFSKLDDMLGSLDGTGGIISKAEVDAERIEIVYIDKKQEPAYVTIDVNNTMEVNTQALSAVLQDCHDDIKNKVSFKAKLQEFYDAFSDVIDESEQCLYTSAHYALCYSARALTEESREALRRLGKMDADDPSCPTYCVTAIPEELLTRLTEYLRTQGFPDDLLANMDCVDRLWGLCLLRNGLCKRDSIPISNRNMVEILQGKSSALVKRKWSVMAAMLDSGKGKEMQHLWLDLKTIVMKIEVESGRIQVGDLWKGLSLGHVGVV